MFCKRCGNQVDADEKFCSNCGFTLNYEQNNGDGKNLNYASFFKRFGAYFIDSLIAGVISFILFLIPFCVRLLTSIENSGFTSMCLAFSMIFCFIGPFIITFLGEVLNKGVSVGQKFMKIQVLDKNGNSPSISDFFLRMLIKVVVPYNVVISFFTILISKKDKHYTM